MQKEEVKLISIPVKSVNEPFWKNTQQLVFNWLNKAGNIKFIVLLLAILAVVVAIFTLIPESGFKVEIWVGKHGAEITPEAQTAVPVAQVSEEKEDWEKPLQVTYIPPAKSSVAPSVKVAHKTYESAVDSSWAYCLWYLKAREGFMKEMYSCPAGKKTIGYGHNVSAHRDVDENAIISYNQASRILKDDFIAQYNVIKAEFPDMAPYKVRAVTCLAMNTGLAKIKYVKGKPKKGLSNFWKKLKNGETPNFDTYCKYRTPQGEVKRSEHLVRARRFEKLMFEQGPKAVQKLANQYRQVVVTIDMKK